MRICDFTLPYRHMLFTFAALLHNACGQSDRGGAELFSLTGEGFSGKKHYFGWGAAAYGDPTMMHNEVKYDVLHTHNIFANEVGGHYQGRTAIGPQVNGSQIRTLWREIARDMTDSDMFVQYSSGHGYSTGLAVGVTYDEIRDNAMAYPAKEIIIFTMACKSGGLVNSFNRRKSEWERWADQGRTLLVMASSPVNENSSTGPGSDPEEPNAPYGSAGSAFGHALWKSLIGHADGYIDGVKDGYLDLEEIIAYTTWKTERVGGHRPVVTGTFQGNLVMNRVPPKAFVDALERGTEGLSDEEIMAHIQELDAAMRL